MPEVGSSVTSMASTRSALVVEASMTSARPVISIKTAMACPRPIVIQARLASAWPVVSVEAPVTGTRSAVLIQAMMTSTWSTTVVSVVSVGVTAIYVEVALNLGERWGLVAREWRQKGAVRAKTVQRNIRIGRKTCRHAHL